MTEWTWWQELAPLSQWLYSGAAFFSILFLWQLVGAILGLMDGDSIDAHHVDLGSDGRPDFGHAGDDIGAGAGHDGIIDHGSVADFKLISLRSLLAFFTLFFWAGALYTSNGMAPFWGLSYAVLWGGAAMAGVATAFYVLRKLVETGTPNIATCVGTRGVVYMDIPSGGQGEIRALVSGAISCVKARSVSGEAIKAGTPVRVLRAVSTTTVEVEPVTQKLDTQGVA